MMIAAANFQDVPATVEILKNDGNMIWAVFSFVDEEAEFLNRGYFIDSIK